MTSAPETLQLSPTLWIWQAFAPAVQSDLYATALRTGHGVYLIDPIPLPQASLDEIIAGSSVAAILVTNANHARSAADFGRQFGKPIFAASDGAAELASAAPRAIPPDGAIAPGLKAIPLEGAAPGEVAFHFANDGGTLVIGDALINFEPYGFTLLPAKYCSDQKLLRRSLRQLLDWNWTRLLFAHGTPLLTDARGRLETLLR